MVSPPPNLTLVSGTILARRPHDRLPDWDVVSLAVDATSPVPGMRDLVGPNILRTASRRSGTGEGDVGGGGAHEGGAGGGGREVAIAVRRELLGPAERGWHLRCRVKLTPDGPMAEPHPADGDLAVTPP